MRDLVQQAPPELGLGALPGAWAGLCSLGSHKVINVPASGLVNSQAC